MRNALSLSLLALALSAAPIVCAGADTVRGRVIDVSDGDSLTAIVDGAKLKLRLWGVDAPETGAGYGVPGQPFAAKARAALRRLVLRKECTFEIVSRDNSGRAVARVHVDGADAGLSLLHAGLAWHDTRFAPHAGDYASAASTARAARRGLWHGEDPLAPWAWRAAQRSRRS